MNFFQKIWCAWLVFVNYFALGYYRAWELPKAVWSYFSERRRLGAQVLAVKSHKVPVGTIMCSKDWGWLPTDIAFPEEMKALRLKFGRRLCYFGKFAVVPHLHGLQIGGNLMKMATAEWAFAHEVDVVVMMVNPSHVKMYLRRGAVVLAHSAGTKGMEKAPAVLMVLELDKSPQAKAWRAEYLRTLRREKGSIPFGLAAWNADIRRWLSATTRLTPHTLMRPANTMAGLFSCLLF